MSRSANDPPKWVSTNEIVATVLRVHRDLRHATGSELFVGVSPCYFGVVRDDVN
jgi:hypothetical protein